MSRRVSSSQRHDQPHAPLRPCSAPNSTTPPRWSASRRPGAGPCRCRRAVGVGPRRRRSGPRARTCRRCGPRARDTRVGRACLSALRSASASTDWARGSTLVRAPRRPSSQSHLQRQVLVVTRRAGRSSSASVGAGVATAAARAGRPAPRAGRPSAACISSAQRARSSSLEAALGAEHERDAEQPLDHSLVDLAREVDPGRSRRARSCWLVAIRALAASAAVLPSVHIVCRSVSVSVKCAAAAVGEDHAEPAPAGRRRRAGERRRPRRSARSAPGTSLSRCSDDLDDAILAKRALRDRRLLERPVDLVQQPRLDAVAADGHHELAHVVVEEQPARAPSTSAGRAPRRGGRRTRGPRMRPVVQAGQQLDEHIQRVGAR